MTPKVPTARQVREKLEQAAWAAFHAEQRGKALAHVEKGKARAAANVAAAQKIREKRQQ